MNGLNRISAFLSLDVIRSATQSFLLVSPTLIVARTKAEYIIILRNWVGVRVADVGNNDDREPITKKEEDLK
jgi:hypothetical protein